MSSSIYHAVLKPQKILFVASSLLYVESVVLILMTVVIGSPLTTVLFAVFSHLFCINLTNREPHINNILRNRFSYLMEFLKLKEIGSPHFITPVMYNDNTRYYYEL